MNKQIIYFQSKDFHLPFMTLQSIGFKFFAKIIRESCVFIVQVALALTLGATLKGVAINNIKSSHKNTVLVKKVENYLSRSSFLLYVVQERAFLVLMKINCYIVF